jgi:hypothetical protein
MQKHIDGRVASELEDLIIRVVWVLRDQDAADTVMLSQNECMYHGQADVCVVE